MKAQHAALILAVVVCRESLRRYTVLAQEEPPSNSFKWRRLPYLAAGWHRPLGSTLLASPLG
jgi:hypothetical protein